MVDSIKDSTICSIVCEVLEHTQGLRDCPAAKTMHQPYLGGLLEHILHIASLACHVCAVYPELDRDLLVAAAILHDIGKTQELSFERSIDYTRRGRLLGHVGIGLQVFAAAVERWRAPRLLDPNTRTAGHPACACAECAKLDHLEHIIASHHGQRAWGALEVPQSREAIMFHLLDMIDSRMGGFDVWAALPVDGLGFTRYIPRLEAGAYIGREAA